MALKIRLARGGAKKRPFYRIVIAEASAPRDGRYVERVGTYNPMVPKDHDQRLTLKNERIAYWLGQGAQPTERVQKMLASAGLADAGKCRSTPKARSRFASTPRSIKASETALERAVLNRADSAGLVESSACPTTNTTSTDGVALI